MFVPLTTPPFTPASSPTDFFKTLFRTEGFIRDFFLHSHILKSDSVSDMELVSVRLLAESSIHLENPYFFPRFLLLLLETLLASFVRHYDLNPKLMTFNARPQERLLLSSTLIILIHTLIYRTVIYLSVQDKLRLSHEITAGHIIKSNKIFHKPLHPAYPTN